MTKKARTVREFIGKSSVYLPLAVLVCAIIHKLLTFKVELFGSAEVSATMSSVIALLLPLMLIARASAPRKISLGSNSLSVSHLFVVLLATVFICVAYVAAAVISDKYLPSSFPISLFNLPHTQSASAVGIIFIAIIPAICEELFFRGVLISEYLKYSSTVALAVSTALSAMFALNLYTLPFACLIGIALGAMRIYTDSTLVPVFMRCVGILSLLLIRGRGFYAVINDNLVIYTILALALLFFSTFVTVMAMARSMPSFTTYADGDFGREEKRLALFSPATVIMLIILLLMR